ncbi:hypothetical protein RUND412_001181 [Rhizina undulata]
MDSIFGKMRMLRAIPSICLFILQLSSRSESAHAARVPPALLQRQNAASCATNAVTCGSECVGDCCDANIPCEPSSLTLDAGNATCGGVVRPFGGGSGGFVLLVTGLVIHHKDMLDVALEVVAWRERDTILPYCVTETNLANSQYLLYCAAISQTAVITHSVGEPATASATTTAAESQSTQSSSAIPSSSATPSFRTTSNTPTTISDNSIITPPPTSSISSTSLSSPQSTNPPSSQNIAEIAGIAVAGVVALALIALCGIFLWKRRSKDNVNVGDGNVGFLAVSDGDKYETPYVSGITELENRSVVAGAYEMDGSRTHMLPNSYELEATTTPHR